MVSEKLGSVLQHSCYSTWWTLPCDLIMGFYSSIWVLHLEALLMWEMLPSAGEMKNTHSGLRELITVGHSKVTWSHKYFFLSYLWFNSKTYSFENYSVGIRKDTYSEVFIVWYLTVCKCKIYCKAVEHSLIICLYRTVATAAKCGQAKHNVTECKHHKITSKQNTETAMLKDLSHVARATSYLQTGLSEVERNSLDISVASEQLRKGTTQMTDSLAKVWNEDV